MKKLLVAFAALLVIQSLLSPAGAEASGCAVPSSPPAVAAPVKIVITPQQAQEAAIKRVPGAVLKDVSYCELDKKTGIYSIGIYYRTKTYEAEVNAETGMVMRFDRPS